MNDNNPAPNPLTIYKGEIVGRMPSDFTEEEFAALGHKKTPLLKVIRSKCLDCCGDQPGEVRKCISSDCVMWPYRMGSNPFHGRSDNPVPPANDNQMDLEEAIANTPE